MRAAVREAVGGQIAISNVAPSQVVFRGGEAVGGQIAESNVAPRHVPVNAAGMVGEPRYAWTLSVTV